MARLGVHSEIGKLTVMACRPGLARIVTGEAGTTITRAADGMTIG